MKTLSFVLATAIMICLGPLLAIPRTGATTFEMGIQPIFPSFNPVIFSILFFGLTLILTIKPSKVVDIIGEYLTPALLIALIFLIIMGIIHPLGDLNEPSTINQIFAEGISLIEKLPFYDLGFNWIVPAIIGALLGNFIPEKKEPECDVLDSAQ